MCGIAGAYARGSTADLELETLLPMLTVLAHRGPDGWGHYLDPGRQALLMHTRLAIVDPEGGRQPLGNEDGTVWVACNGEIYDYRRIAADLRTRGHLFRSDSDSEVIVHLYEEYGDAFVEQLRGEFAFALLDLRRDRLLLVRDRFGVKPLYYSEAGGLLLFASEIKGLLRHPHMRAEIDREYAVHLLGGLLMPGETLFRGVRQVEPGCFLEVSRRGCRTRRYWDLTFEDRDLSNIDEAACVEEFGRLFDEAVALRLQGDAEVGAYLSGGIDSAAVAMVMAQKTARPLKAFTIAFDDPKYDELAPAREVASAGRMDHHILTVGAGELGPHFVRALWHFEAPVLNSHGVAKFLLSELASRHVKAVLTGQGADEVLAGYAPFEHQLLLDRLEADPGDSQARRQLSSFGRRGSYLDVQAVRRYPSRERVRERFGAYPYSVMRPLLHQSRIRRLLAPDLRRAKRDVDSLGELARRLDCSRMRNVSSTAATQYVLFKTDLPGYILSTLVDRPEMAHSIEGRVPFLDHRLVAFVAGLPRALKIDGMENKILLRRAMAGRVPESVRVRPKQLFLAPSAGSLGLNRPNNPLVATYLTTERIRDLGIFDPVRLRLVLAGLRCAPAGSRTQALCEAVTMAALALHILDDLFRRDFRGSADRYTSRRVDFGALP